MNEMASRIEKQLADQTRAPGDRSTRSARPLEMRLLIEFAREKSEANLVRLRDAKDPLGELASSEREVTEIDVLVSDLLASSRIDFTAITRTEARSRRGGQNRTRAGIDRRRQARPAERTHFVRRRRYAGRARGLEPARKCQASRGCVETLRVETRAGFVAFIVEDNGRGFEAGEESRVFEPFYKRAPPGSKADESVGLGLASSRRSRRPTTAAYSPKTAPEAAARVGVEFAR